MKKYSLGILTCCLACAAFAGRAPLPPGAVPPKPWLVINEDNDRYFKRADLPGNIEKTTAEACEQYLDTVLDGGKVTHFFMGSRSGRGWTAWRWTVRPPRTTSGASTRRR